MAASASAEQYWGLFREETDWYNEIFLTAVVPGSGGWWRALPHPLRSWLRNCIGGYLLYFATGFLWCFVIYYWKRNAYIPKVFRERDLGFGLSGPLREENDGGVD